MKFIQMVLVSILIFSCSEDESMQVVNNPEEEIETIIDFQGVVESSRTFGGAKNELANSVVKTVDGGYAVLGYTQSNDGDITDKPNEDFDYWVMKFNVNDELEWNKTYGGALDDRGNKIIQTNDGGYAIVGYSESSDNDATQNAGSYDFWVVKLTSSGIISWEKSIGYTGSDKGLSIIQTVDNGYLLSGVIDVTASGGEGNSKAVLHAGGDYWTIKLNAGGIIQWTKYFGGSLNDTLFDAIQTADGGFVLVGSSDSEDVDISNNKGTYDFWVVKINAVGALVWEKNFGGSEIDEARGVVLSGDGNYLIVGDTRSVDGDISQNSGAADLWLIKVTPNGELLWEKTYGGSSFDVGRAITKTQDGGFLIAGSSRSQDGDVNANKGQNDAWVLKINNSGIIEQQKTIGGSDIDFAYGIAELNDKKVVVVGESNSSDFDVLENKGFTDLLIVKMK